MMEMECLLWIWKMSRNRYRQRLNMFLDFEESEDNGFSSPRGDEIEGDTTEIEDDDEEGEDEEEEEFDPLSDANMTPIGRNDITPHGAHDTAISIIDFGTMVDHVHRKELSQSSRKWRNSIIVI